MYRLHSSFSVRVPWLRSRRRLGSALLGAFLFGFVALLAGDAPSVDREPPSASVEVQPPIQIFLVRHAEKNTDDPSDPGLTPAGQQRARTLARILRHAGVSHLFVTQYKRTRLTLAPLAEDRALEPEVVDAGQTASLVAALTGLPAGSIAVVAGHSNTIPGIVEALGGKVERVDRTARGPMLRDHEYDRLFLVTIPAGGGDDERFSPSSVELSYGEP